MKITIASCALYSTLFNNPILLLCNTASASSNHSCRDSLNRESELQCALRRLKDGLISAALRSQVAVKLVNDDNSTIQELRKDAEDARSQPLTFTI